MAAAVYDILIEQGATFRLHILYKDSDGDPINLTGYSARMQVRRKVSSTTALLTFTTTNGAITLGGVAGTIDIVGSATVTDDVTGCCGVYDLELVAPSGIVTRLIQGNATISPEVTRD